MGPRTSGAQSAPAPVRDLIDLASEAVHTMLVADSVADAQDAPDGGWSVVFEGHTIRGASSLGAVDLEAEAARLTAKVTECARASRDSRSVWPIRATWNAPRNTS